MNKITIAITHGDTNGIGYEVIFKTFAAQEMLELCTPIIYGSPKVAKYHLNALGMEANFSIINSPKDAHQDKLNLIPVFDEDIKIDFGQPSKEAGTAALKALEAALADYKEGLVDALVTAPINKNNIQSEEFDFCGHTEYIQNRVGEGKEALMILMNKTMRVALATTHLPIAEIAQHIRTELIERKVEILNESLKSDFRITQPRIAVLALNPHAGDDGLLGKEEEEIIRPAIKNLQQRKVVVYGPYPADGFFARAHYQHFDAVLAMYHDQGLAPFKALCDGDGINFTAGLPIVRTSPDHGTGYEIAGKGVADEQSFRNALYSAIDIVRNRLNYLTPMANPLPKLYHERKDESEKVRFNIPKKAEQKEQSSAQKDQSSAQKEQPTAQKEQSSPQKESPKEHPAAPKDSPKEQPAAQKDSAKEQSAPKDNQSQPRNQRNFRHHGHRNGNGNANNSNAQGNTNAAR